MPFAGRALFRLVALCRLMPYAGKAFPKPFAGFALFRLIAFCRLCLIQADSLVQALPWSGRSLFSSLMQAWTHEQMHVRAGARYHRAFCKLGFMNKCIQIYVREKCVSFMER